MLFFLHNQETSRHPGPFDQCMHVFVCVCVCMFVSVCMLEGILSPTTPLPSNPGRPQSISPPHTSRHPVCEAKGCGEDCGDLLCVIVFIALGPGETSLIHIHKTLTSKLSPLKSHM